MECKQQNNMQYCNCTFSCSKKGQCCTCLHYHRRMGELPACYFPKDYESSGDRSIDSFMRIYRERGGDWLN